MSNTNKIDPQVAALLAADPHARCRVVITFVETAGGADLGRLNLRNAVEIEGLPGVVSAELGATDLTRLKNRSDVKAVDLDSEQQALF